MSAPARILVVDDTPRNVKLLGDLLTVRGYAVITAPSGAEALGTIEAERPDLVLLDVVMPEWSRDYGAIGTVTNLAFRLCGEARPALILASRRPRHGRGAGRGGSSG
jgi:CheY-like chemotaxis protein